MKDPKEIREIRRNIRNMTLAGAGALGMFIYAGSQYYNMQLSARNTTSITPHFNNEIAVAHQATTTGIEIPDLLPEITASGETSSETKTKTAPIVTTVEEIQSFEVSCNNGSLVFNWVTEGKGQYAYEIEKTTSGGTFEVFLRAPQPEKKDGLNYYSVEENVDVNELASYRLKRILGKHKFEYTEPVQVQCQKKPAKEITVDVFPSGYGAFRILVNSPEPDMFKVILFDATEKEIESREFGTNKGLNEFVLESGAVTKGNYTLRITNGSTTKEKRIVLK